jgi:hypothetical protein
MNFLRNMLDSMQDLIDKIFVSLQFLYLVDKFVLEIHATQ